MSYPRRRGRKLHEALCQVEKDLIEREIRRQKGNVRAAAEELGVNRTHLYKRMRKFSIKPPGRNRGNAAWQALGN